VRPLPFALLVPLAALLAGCGSPPVNHFTLAKTRACLADTGAQIVKPTSDFVAGTASEGTFRAVLHGGSNFVTLAFGADEAEAVQLAQGYDRFHGKNIGVADILYQDKNVTMLWKLHPADDELKLVTDCLT
jgi:hypothetical protein